MATALPTHPTLVHPVTGRPLRAVFVSARTGRAYWPVIGASEPPEPAPAPAPTPEPPAPEPDGFPANTPLEQMKPEQREAYWKHQSRKHEDRVKALGNLTPEQLADLRKKAARHDALELELASESEKAARKAADEAKTATRAELEPAVINAKLDAAAARAGVSEEDLTKALAFVDTRKFLTDDGTVDTDKVKAFVATIAPDRGSQQPARRGPSATAHGNGAGPGLAGGSARDKGLAEAKRRGFVTAD
jgi:hypothetical protein